MRKITVLEFMSLDGVIQAPGGPEEDSSATFEFGGWQAPFVDSLVDEVANKELKEPVEYLLGRKTFDIWADYWPQHNDVWPGINNGMKYVLSSTMHQTDWENTKFIDSLEDVKKLKESDGPDIQVWGSSQLVHLLLENDLVDKLRLMTYPLVLGKGKRVFTDNAMPVSLKLLDSKVGLSGTIIAWYERAGDVKTGIM